MVETRYGAVRGFAGNGVQIFKGIPYGRSTAGAGRFMPPQPPIPWAGVRETVALGPSAPAAFGVAADTMNNPDIIAMIEGAAEYVPSSEDCLVLNVWTPGADVGAKRPVMVWCHGGGFFAGSGGGKWNDGANLAAHGDVVVVSFNHRLNILGFLYLAELADGRYPDSGNVGMLDVVAALEWVRDNIAAFGGDPDNVTVFGQSGGGFKISMLMAMPAAQGLFRKAIVQSGSVVRGNPPSIAARHAEWVLHHLGLNQGSIGALETIPLDRLMDAATMVLNRVSVPGENPFAPVVDGRSLPRDPFEPDAPSISAGIPMLIGTTKDESRMLLAGDVANFDLTEDQMRSRLIDFLEVGPDETDRIIGVFRAARPTATPSDIFFAVTNARMLWINALSQAERKAAQGGGAVYMYRFDWNIPILGGKLGAPHGATVPFVFRTIDAAKSMVGLGPERKALSDRMSAAWLAFARTGNPNHSGLDHWPAFDLETRATMIFDNECKVVNDLDAAERIAMRAVPPMQI
ncbi:MAG TPA: carboxylesterase/lipase family protein [Alphaproteobacteria bacterium]|jgi:para-nitrobenzyl esterase|nr:carboxylesterase/lipase family protein [Alphaproteobacteria bacterium]